MRLLSGKTLKPYLLSVKPDNTNLETIYSSGPSRIHVLGMTIANASASTAEATIIWNDGTDDWELVFEKEIYGNDTLFEPEFYVPLNEGCSLKARSSIPNSLTFTVTLIEGGRV